MIKKVSFLMFMVSLSLQGQVDESESALRTFSLQQAQNYSLQHSYLIRNQVYEIEKAKKTIKETAALYFPQISANVDMTHNAIIQPIAFPTDPDQNPFAPPSTPGTPAPENDFQYITLGGGKYQNTWGVRANWMIGSYSNFLAKQASEVLKETRQLDKEEAEISIKADVAKAFYRVLVWEESVRLLRENLEPLQKSLFENRQLFQNGFVEEQDVNQVELLVSNLDNSLENAKRQGN